MNLNEVYKFELVLSSQCHLFFIMYQWGKLGNDTSHLFVLFLKLLVSLPLFQNKKLARIENLNGFSVYTNIYTDCILDTES
jgi:hypothetical protein